MLPAIFGLSGLTLTDDERAFFRDADPAGYIYFGRNVESREQLKALSDELRALHGRDRLLIMIDQEGGRVQRMKPPVWPAYPAGEAFSRLYDIAPISGMEAARVNAQAIALDLAEVGITVDALPLLDVRKPGAHDVIGDRALGENAMKVASLGRATLDGLGVGGVTGIVKHMPGHGRAGCDSHKELPTVTCGEDELAEDIAAFEKLADAPVGMTGHIRFPVWDQKHPATLSSAIVSNIIRDRIGFDGLLMTDDIDMEALDGPVPDRAVAAIEAGCDLILNCWAKMDDMTEMAARLPAMTDRASERLDAALAWPDDRRSEADHGELIAKRDALLAIAAEAGAQ